MPPTARLRHVTRYRYERPARHGPHIVRLCPVPRIAERVKAFRLEIAPSNVLPQFSTDLFDNRIARLSFPEPVAEFALSVELEADLAPINPFDFALESRAVTTPIAYDTDEVLALAPFLSGGDFEDDVGVLAGQLPPPGGDTVEFLIAAARTIFEATAYGEREQPGVQTPTDTLRMGSGSCRDMAWLLVTLLRLRGFAARFVSGYLIEPERGMTQSQTAGGQSQTLGGSASEDEGTELHAWAEAYCPGAGWIGLDATSGLLTAERHVALAAAPRPDLAAPVSGSVEPVRATLSHEMSAVWTS